MKTIKYKTRKYTEESWWKKHNAPLPLEAFGYPIRHRQTKKQAQENYWARHYDKLKTVKFKTGHNLNMEKYFYMPKLIPNWDFSKYKNAMAAYPVLCGRADFYDDTKWVRISRENIGKLAGIWAGAVDKGIAQLQGLDFKITTADEPYSIPLLQRREWTDGKRRGWEYMPGFFRYGMDGLDPHRWRGKYFAFHTCIVDSGIWSELSRKQKALYLAWRSKAFFDQHAYEHIEGIRIPQFKEMYEDYFDGHWTYDPDNELNAGEAKKLFRNRKWDVCDAPLKELFELAQIPYNNTREVVDGLEESGLVERVHETKSIFKVYLSPKSLLKNLNVDNLSNSVI